ncbi:MAG: F0F1 ATP synthase subunit B [Candidatus Sungbacteria bacterium]|nr:F0F1 ATP synthase subunit B [Candidatus Sungbacteria bacterium]
MSELISKLGIDWRLLLAQAVNFFLLLFLLKKFAYKPILVMLARRRQEIEKGFQLRAEAEETLKNADALREQTLQQTRTDALAMVNEAEQVGKKRQEEIIAEAAKKSEQIVHDAKRIIAQEKAIMGDEVYAVAQELICSGLVKVLGKIPHEERDRELIRDALAELKTVSS